MGFDELDGGRAVARLLIGPTDRLDLTAGARCRDALAASVAARTDATDDGLDSIPIANCIREALECQCPTALAHDKAVGSGIERGGMAGRERSDGTEFGEGRRVHGAVARSRDHQIDLAGMQKSAGIEHGSEGGCTSRIGRIIRTLEVEQVGHPPTDDIGQFAGHCVLIDLGQTVEDGILERILARRRHAAGLDGVASEMVGPNPMIGEVSVFASQGIGEDDAGAGMGEFLRPLTQISGIFERSRTDRDSPQLGRINLRQGPGGNAVAAPIELEALDPSTNLRVGLVLIDVLRTALDMEIRGVPAIAGHILQRDLGGQHVLPEGRGIVRVGQQGRDTDHSDRFERILRILVKGCQSIHLSH